LAATHNASTHQVATKSAVLVVLVFEPEAGGATGLLRSSASGAGAIVVPSPFLLQADVNSRMLRTQPSLLNPTGLLRDISMTKYNRQLRARGSVISVSTDKHLQDV